MGRGVSTGRGLSVAIAVVTTALLFAATTASAQTPSPTPSGSGTPSPSPSGSEGDAPTGPPSIALVNPSAGYDPRLDPGGADPPKVSDKDGPYQVVAWSANTPQNAIAELYIRYPNSQETDIGVMNRVGESTWEYEWDVPTSFAVGDATLTVYLYDVAFSGPNEIASDSVAVEMRHKAAVINTHDDPAPDDMFRFTTIEPGGPLGFYKPAGPFGQWRAGIVGKTALVLPGGRIEAFYSTTEVGQKPVFRRCGFTKPASPPQLAADRDLPVVCTLQLLDLPSDVTAVATVAEHTHDVSGTFAYNQEAASAMPVVPYYQNPKETTIELVPWQRTAVDTCSFFRVYVLDPLGQPIIGANVDAHAVGPNDQLHFSPQGNATPESQAPDKAHGSIQQSAPCGNPTETASGQEARHRNPGGPDELHRESASGTGLSGSAVGPGEWRFTIRSGSPGITDILVWVDGEPIPEPDEAAPLDSDTLDEGEPFARARLQSFGAPPKLTFDPLGRMGLVGDCVPLTIKARSATVGVQEINVDVHVTGPSDEVDFCDPTGANPRNAPAPGPSPSPHVPEDAGESRHDETGADPQHTEGETDNAGNFTFGLRSPVVGDSTIIAWIDGEKGEDDDTQAFIETTARAQVSWGMGEPLINFINPSAYGTATDRPGNGTQLPDDGGKTTIRTRVFSLEPIDGVEFLLKSQTGSFEPIGHGTQIGTTGVYEFPWEVDEPDGPYTLRARVRGTSITSDIDVNIGAGSVSPDAPRPAHEGVVITSPPAAAPAAFTRSVVTIKGAASPGTETVDLFYTKVPSTTTTPTGADWIFCGYADIDGMGNLPQSFSGSCALREADQPNEVSGLAAIAFDCSQPGCDGQPDPAEPPAPSPLPQAPPSPFPSPAVPRADGQKDTGDAVPVFGFEAHPALQLEPVEDLAEVRAGACRRFDAVLKDQTGQPIRDSNIDLHFEGPEGSGLCDPGDASAWRYPDEGEHFLSETTDPVQSGYHLDPSDGSRVYHVEAETPQNGRLVFGLTSEALGDTRLELWLDRDDNDVRDSTDPFATGVLHWVEATGCGVVGTDGPDLLVGTSGADVICGLGGRDRIKGRGGNDLLVGGGGADAIKGGKGRDVLRGGGAADRLNGGPGKDKCRGGAGKDRAKACENPGAKPPPRRHNLV